jgi:mevalonate kinase
LRSEYADAPSKLILLGEHAAVYGERALASPLSEPKARAIVREEDGLARVDLPDLGVRFEAGQGGLPPEALPFARILDAAAAFHPAVELRGWRLSVRSSIPVGCGLGSGASVSTASFRAIFRFFRVPHGPEEVSRLVYEIEKLHHGTPSGIDNTVISQGAPILFRKGEAPRLIAEPGSPPWLAVGFTGGRRRTAEVVSDIARARAADPDRYGAIFREMGEISGRGAEAYEKGLWPELGRLMDRNQGLLEDIGVSSPSLGGLIGAARRAGALGAKLSGAGRGGCMAALAGDLASARRIRDALREAGAAATFLSGRNGENP